MLADLLTKGLSPNVFREHIAGMGLRKILWFLDSKGPKARIHLRTEKCLWLSNLTVITVMMKHAQYTDLWWVGLTKRESTNEIRGRMLDWSQAQPNGWGLSPLDRALIGGAQPIYGWWAPDALRYKKKEWGTQARKSRFAVHSTHSTNPRPSDRLCAVASRRTTAPPPYYSFPTVVGQCRWRPEGRRHLHHCDVSIMDASGSTLANDGLNPKLLDLFHCLSFVPRLDTLLVDPVNLSPTSKIPFEAGQPD
jgi:hypothetical protein